MFQCLSDQLTRIRLLSGFKNKIVDKQVGPGTNCSAIFGENGWAQAIKQYSQLGWEIWVIFASNAPV